jgi:hypothetical protein
MEYKIAYLGFGCKYQLDNGGESVDIQNFSFVEHQNFLWGDGRLPECRKKSAAPTVHRGCVGSELTGLC